MATPDVGSTISKDCRSSDEEGFGNPRRSTSRECIRCHCDLSWVPTSKPLTQIRWYDKNTNCALLPLGHTHTDAWEGMVGLLVNIIVPEGWKKYWVVGVKIEGPVGDLIVSSPSSIHLGWFCTVWGIHNSNLQILPNPQWWKLKFVVCRHVYKDMGQRLCVHDQYPIICEKNQSCLKHKVTL